MADDVSGAVYRAGTAHGRPTGRIEHRDRQVVTRRATDTRAELDGLSDHQLAEVQRSRENHYPAGCLVIPQPLNRRPEHQPAPPQRHWALAGGDRDQRGGAKCHGDWVAIDRLGA